MLRCISLRFFLTGAAILAVQCPNVSSSHLVEDGTEIRSTNQRVTTSDHLENMQVLQQGRLLVKSQSYCCISPENRRYIFDLAARTAPMLVVSTTTAICSKIAEISLPAYVSDLQGSYPWSHFFIRTESISTSLMDFRPHSSSHTLPFHTLNSWNNTLIAASFAPVFLPVFSDLIKHRCADLGKLSRFTQAKTALNAIATPTIVMLIANSTYLYAKFLNSLLSYTGVESVTACTVDQAVAIFKGYITCNPWMGLVLSKDDFHTCSVKLLEELLPNSSVITPWSYITTAYMTPSFFHMVAFCAPLIAFLMNIGLWILL